MLSASSSCSRPSTATPNDDTCVDSINERCHAKNKTVVACQDVRGIPEATGTYSIRMTVVIRSSMSTVATAALINVHRGLAGTLAAVQLPTHPGATTARLKARTRGPHAYSDGIHRCRASALSCPSGFACCIVQRGVSRLTVAHALLRACMACRCCVTCIDAAGILSEHVRCACCSGRIQPATLAAGSVVWLPGLFLSHHQLVLHRSLHLQCSSTQCCAPHCAHHLPCQTLSRLRCGSALKSHLPTVFSGPCPTPARLHPPQPAS
jgi:hypothetical protein